MSDWKPENSIVDSEVAVMAKKSAIAEFNIIERETDVYYVTMRLHHWREGSLHLVTRRVRDEPRLFMNLGRLVTHIREKYGTITEIKLMLLPVLPVEELSVLDRRGSNFGGRMPAADEKKRLSTLREVLAVEPLAERPYTRKAAAPAKNSSKPGASKTPSKTQTKAVAGGARAKK